jgi:hypothetical protein
MIFVAMVIGGMMVRVFDAMARMLKMVAIMVVVVFAEGCEGIVVVIVVSVLFIVVVIVQYGGLSNVIQKHSDRFV